MWRMHHQLLSNEETAEEDTALSASASPPNAAPKRTSSPSPSPSASGAMFTRSSKRRPVAPDVTRPEVEASPPRPSNFLHSPPDSNNATKSEDSDSELSDLDENDDLGIGPDKEDQEDEDKEDAVDEEDEEDKHDKHDEEDKEDKEDKKQDAGAQTEEEEIGEIEPDHWSGTVPVFKPTMHQFKDFKLFMERIDKFGMKSGIVKIIPPQEWRTSLPPIDDLIKQVRVRDPIKQDIMGSNGTYRQVNILHQRSYNLPQWRSLCDQSEHQPPARRGERRANVTTRPRPKPRTGTAPSAPKASLNKKRGGQGGRSKRAKLNTSEAKDANDDAEEEDHPMTPVSPKLTGIVESVENDPDIEQEAASSNRDHNTPAAVGRMGSVKKPKTQSVSARRKYSRREGSTAIDEEAFRDWNYHLDISDYTPERCEELERIYWKTLTYAQPLYGADLMGTLFHESTDVWNLNRLPNLLDALGTQVPGVNTAYLYLGMWKATFAWHLEDVDLYSINYLHFGAPKQWYSISQADARRFEAAMKNLWPTEAKACDQFLRHKAFLISPQHLLHNYNIKVNKVVSYPGEFVVTYPYGYHSGYNLGYNCAEAVNFALDSWLSMGKIAKRCECAQAQDSVWVDVYEIERKLRGEETEYEMTDDKEDEDEDEEDGADDDEDMSGLPSPPNSSKVKFAEAFGGKKRKNPFTSVRGERRVKKIKLRIKPRPDAPCCLCPNATAGTELLKTEDGRRVHRMCALYLPEPFIDTVDGQEVVVNLDAVPKARLDLKCLLCRSRKGACLQCSQKHCTRSYHATCAAAAGVFVEDAEVPVFGDDGTEYKDQAFEFSCRFHRTRRDKRTDAAALEADERIRGAARALDKGDICQMQYLGGEIFAGVVVETRRDEETVLIDMVPAGDRIEVEWKWLVVADPSDYHLIKASANAIPLPPTRKAQEELNAKRSEDEVPRKDNVFVEGGFTWAEFNVGDEISNSSQASLDLGKPGQLWHYIGEKSTDARPQYTDALSKRVHNPESNFLETVLPRPPRPAMPASRRKTQNANGQRAGATAGTAALLQSTQSTARKSYTYKPRSTAAPEPNPNGLLAGHRWAPPSNSSPAEQCTTGPAGGVRNGPYTSLGMALAPAMAAITQGTQNPAAQGLLSRYQATNGLGLQRAPQSQPGADRAMAPPQPHTPSELLAQYQARTRTGSTQAQPSQAAHPQHRRFVNTTALAQSIYARYPFFQVYHNRDSSQYRTPYVTGGLHGFTNGFEGDLRAHLISQLSMTPPGQATTPPALTPARTTCPPTWVSTTSPHPTQRSASAMPNTASSRPATTPAIPEQGRSRSSTLDIVAPLPFFLRAPAPAAPAQATAAAAASSPGQLEPAHTAILAPPHLPGTMVGNKPKVTPVPLPAGFLTAMSTSSSAASTPSKPGPSPASTPVPTVPTVPAVPAVPALQALQANVHLPMQSQEVNQQGTAVASNQASWAAAEAIHIVPAEREHTPLPGTQPSSASQVAPGSLCRTITPILPPSIPGMPSSATRPTPISLPQISPPTSSLTPAPHSPTASRSRSWKAASKQATTRQVSSLSPCPTDVSMPPAVSAVSATSKLTASSPTSTAIPKKLSATPIMPPSFGAAPQQQSQFLAHGSLWSIPGRRNPSWPNLKNSPPPPPQTPWPHAPPAQIKLSVPKPALSQDRQEQDRQAPSETQTGSHTCPRAPLKHHSQYSLAPPYPYNMPYAQTRREPRPAPDASVIDPVLMMATGDEDGSAGDHILPDVPADSTPFLERMMLNLRKASEREGSIAGST